MNRVAPTAVDVAPSLIVVIPLGSWEQHGPHLPVDTDTVIIDAVVSRAMDLVTSPTAFMVAPTLPITASDEHAGFPGGLSMGTEATQSALVSIGRSSSWATGVCFVNGHGGNSGALSAAVSALAHEGITHSVWSLPAYAGSDMHAGHTETSLMLHISPDRVRRDRFAPGAAGERGDLIAGMRAAGVKSVSPNGVIGDPTGATAAHGAEVLAMYARSLADHLNGLEAAWSTT